MKKIILLCCCLLVLVSTCFAFSDIANETDSSLIDELENYGIIAGYSDGSFHPQAHITRAEFAKMVVCATGYNFTECAAGEVFTDVPASHWANDYICIAKKFGVVNGTSDTTFSPGANVTYEQAIKMLVCALGYGEKAMDQGGYPDGYIKQAEKLGVTAGISFAQTDYASRINIAKMIGNTLDVVYEYFYESEGQILQEPSVITLREMHNMRLRSREEF